MYWYSLHAQRAADDASAGLSVDEPLGSLGDINEDEEGDGEVQVQVIQLQQEEEPEGGVTIEEYKE